MSDKRFCRNCGSKLDDDSDFCSNCGTKVNKTVNTESQQTTNNAPKTSSSIINRVMARPKLIMLAIIVIIALVGITSLGGVFSNDIVDVTSIEMSVSYSDTPFGGAVESSIAGKQDEAQRLLLINETNPEQYKQELQFSGMTEEEVIKYGSSSGTNHTDYQVGMAVTKFSLMPRETITRVTGLAVTNIEVSLENGETENWGTYTFNPKDLYLQDTNYKFTISKTLEDSDKSIEDYYTISHIKADIVMNTTDETNVVIGHINEDIIPTHY